jgi:hypothetical protein
MEALERIVHQGHFVEFTSVYSECWHCKVNQSTRDRRLQLESRYSYDTAKPLKICGPIRVH